MLQLCVNMLKKVRPAGRTGAGAVALTKYFVILGSPPGTIASIAATKGSAGIKSFLLLVTKAVYNGF